MSFSTEELERYSRQLILKDVGYRGQKKLSEAQVLIIGAGGLGSPAALYLAAAGVGTVGIVDADVVDLSNLQRQIIHGTLDVGLPKVESARQRMLEINPHIEVVTYREYLTSANILKVLDGWDFVIDGTDNFPAKFLINDACVMKGIPFSHGGIMRFRGQLMTVVPHESPCYRCVFKEPPPKGAVPSCREAGVIGAIAGVVGSLQALEAVKYVVGAGELLTGRLLTIDTLTMTMHTVKLPQRGEGCRVCSDNPAITELIDCELPTCELKGEGAKDGD